MRFYKIVCEKTDDMAERDYYDSARFISEDDALDTIRSLEWEETSDTRDVLITTRRKKVDKANIEALEKYILDDFRLINLEGYYYATRHIGDCDYVLYCYEGIWGTSYSIAVKIWKYKNCKIKTIPYSTSIDEDKILFPIKVDGGYTFSFSI